MNYLWIAFEAFINFLYGIIFCVFAVKYFGFKYFVKKRCLITLLFSFILFIAISVCNYFIIFEGFLGVIYGVIVFIFALIFLDGNVWKKIYIAALQQIFLAGIVLVITFLNSLMFDTEVNEMLVMNFNTARFISMVIILVIYVIMLRLILYLKKEFNEMKNSHRLIFISIVVVSIILIISIMEIVLLSESSTVHYIFIAISIASILALNILMYIFISVLNRNNKIITKYQLENQQKIYEEKNLGNIENMYEKIKILKHDMKHHNEVITTQINYIPEVNNSQKNHINDIISYISGVSKNIDIIKTSIYTGNRTIDNLINYKLGIAAEKNIKTETIIDKNISGIADTDLCSILGNLLDNAIEACEKCNFDNKIIVLHITIKNPCILISVKNSIAKSVLADNPNLITEKQEKEFHGIGIKSIKTIAEKYFGRFNIREEENFFVAEVLLIRGNMNK